jgi:hypothetical protein
VKTLPKRQPNVSLYQNDSNSFTAGKIRPFSVHNFQSKYKKVKSGHPVSDPHLIIAAVCCSRRKRIVIKKLASMPLNDGLNQSQLIESNFLIATFADFQ